ncbi:GNAT family N-acetyltransferase [Micromonospora sp. WMMA1363]|uniref:GNAT family N-acetyltransferase n=1 Tax=Micromonospora sp. WMMA1363 TaxID=3053985 RepID=UPI00259CF003|nr:GNAT family N-acetyltransferase [Micromonospora sp. WMMA1363]MDM4719611.1 GNAT family N-acetyltransferase [Micromonospora sp. WMMA1363]
MTYVVRRIEPGEWRQLHALRLEALRDSPTAFGTTYADTAALSDEVRRQQAASNATSPTSATFIAATEYGRWVGMASSAPLEEVPGHAHIHGVYVAPAHRGQEAGLATRLMDVAIRWTRDNTDAAWLTLGVHEDNTRAQAFYRRIGFTETGKVVPYPLDPSMNLYIMGYEDFRRATTLPAHLDSSEGFDPSPSVSV